MLPKILFTLLIICTISITPAFAETLDLKASGLNIHYAISYDSTGVLLNSVSPDLDFISLIFEVSVLESTNDVSITFPRDIFDAKIGDDDDEFYVLADGEEIGFEEEKDASFRTLHFSMPVGTEELEVVGTILLGASYLQDLAAQAAEDTAKKEAEQDAVVAAMYEQVKKDAAETAARQAALEEAEAKAEVEAYDARQAFLEASCAEGTTYTADEGCIVVEEELPDSGPLIYSIFAAMGIGLAVMIILWGIGRSRHKKSSVVESDDS